MSKSLEEISTILRDTLIKSFTDPTINYIKFCMKTINDSIHRQLLECCEGREFLHHEEVDKRHEEVDKIRKEKRAIRARERYLLKLSQQEEVDKRQEEVDKIRKEKRAIKARERYLLKISQNTV
jgi:hypothetical protein